jgi:misacylated tRNA(Ala) deacylase
MTATTLLFRDDAYAASCQAKVIVVTPEGGVILDRTIFYAQGGGQPGDSGAILRANGETVEVTNTVYGADRSQVAHQVGAEAAARFETGETVELQLDWAKRFKRMRVHTALHLLSVVLPYPVTGGAIGDGDGRLDFDIPDAGLDHVGEASPRIRSCSPGRDRGNRPAALRRHPCAPHRRDRHGRGHRHREEG